MIEIARDTQAHGSLAGEESFAQASELTDVEKRTIPMPPHRHRLARRLGTLLTDPRVTGDFFETVWVVRAAVNRPKPPKQVMDDARFLLAWFRESSATPVPTVEAALLAPERPVMDEAAKAAALRRSIAAALTYNMANSYGTTDDAAAMAAALRPQE